MLKVGDMEQVFKQNLLRLRSPQKPSTYREALFPMAWWPSELSVSNPGDAKISKEQFSEKKQVIESFERFAHEKIKETGAPIQVEGGIVSISKDPVWDGIQKFTDLKELKDRLTLDREILELVLTNKDPSKVKVLFVTETFRSADEVMPELKEGFINELLAGFPLKTAEFFGRMISAMKLVPEEVVLYPVESEGKDLASEVVTLAAFLRPEVVITLGAKATNKILKNNDRLSMVHGQFFKREVEGIGNFHVVPLYNPFIIETNQNMKKTAWTDMQKIMKFLQKLI